MDCLVEVEYLLENVLHPFAKASLSLQSAAHKFVVEKTGFKKPLRNVRLGSSCEVSTTCQTVLAQTYNHCNYPDIMDIQLGATCGNYCSTHGKFCKPQKKTNTRSLPHD